MTQSQRSGWIPVAILAGAAYLIVGRVFAWPTTHAQAWRLAAWIVSAGIFGTHFLYEQFTVRPTPSAVAWHTATGVALGALALAIVGAMRSLSLGSSPLSSWLLAFVLWPAFTAVPAFLVAWAGSVIFTRVRHRLFDPQHGEH